MVSAPVLAGQASLTRYLGGGLAGERQQGLGGLGGVGALVVLGVEVGGDGDLTGMGGKF